jgi:hypothetical protein
MKKSIYLGIIFFISFFINNAIQAQSYAFGIKGGPSFGYQTWNDRSRPNSILARYHGALYIESHDNELDRSSFYGQVGYHIRGSAVRFRGGVNLDGMTIPPRTSALEFHNLGVQLGVKGKRDLAENQKWYYLIGLRAEYTIDSRLDIYQSYQAFIEPFNYGLSIGGGWQFNFTELIGIVAELGIHPDLSRQVFVPPIPNWPDPFTGENRTLPEQVIRNASIELSIGFRFLRKIEYIDDYW